MVTKFTPSAVMSCGVARRAANVALGDLGHQAFERAARRTEFEQLDLAIAVVEVKAPFVRSTVDASSFDANLVEDLLAALDIAVDRGVLCCAPHRIVRLGRFALSLPRLVAFPCLWRIVGFAAGHIRILSAGAGLDLARNRRV